jgi:hypothetical protein
MHKCAVLASLLASFLNGQSLSDLSWLAGHWTGTAGRAEVEESWLPPKGGGMLGVSRTVAGNRMIAFEFLRIEQRRDGVYYLAQPAGRPATEFKLTESSNRAVVFENPAHDHPKIIRYWMENGNTLVAVAEGEENGKHRLQEFRFHRLAQR